jgi:hypothetical protein
LTGLTLFTLKRGEYKRQKVLKGGGPAKKKKKG